MVRLKLSTNNCQLSTILMNDLFLRTLNGEATERTPVWMMRQAGRYLPDFRALRAKYSFFERCQNPEIATAITMMPIDQMGVDAAIIFSDILVVPQALGIHVEMNEGTGPNIPTPIRSMPEVANIVMPDVADRLSYVFEALKLTKKTLAGRVPLIGFAGSPWTILCYVVEGKGSKTFDIAKKFLFEQPKAAHLLLDKITEVTIEYLKLQHKAGADAIQVFDSWGGLLSPDDFKVWSLPYMQRIVTALKAEGCPTIVFSKGQLAYKAMAETGCNAMGLDWCSTPKDVRKAVGQDLVLQGNFDPAKLYLPIPELRKEVKKMLKSFGNHHYIANLGHGILPNIAPDHARAFIDAVKEYSSTLEVIA